MPHKNSEDRKKYTKDYHARNKDKRNEESRLYRLKNKEELKRKRREKAAENREKAAEYARKWRAKNKDKVKEQNDKRKPKDRDLEYSVYYLPEEHYVGMTKRLSARISKHKTQHGRNTDGWRVLRTFDNPFDAHIYETQWHKMGAHGFGIKY